MNVKSVEKEATRASVTGAYALAREEGFDHINMDLIAALPGETTDDFRRTLEKVRELNPESVTVHSLVLCLCFRQP